MFSEMIKNCHDGIFYTYYISLSECEYITLIRELKGTSIHTLQLSVLSLSDRVVNALASGLKDTSIQTINVRISPSQSTDQISAAEVSSAMKKLKKLPVNINLQFGYQLDFIAMQALSDGLKDTNIQILQIGGKLDATLFNSLMIGIKGSSIQELDVQTNLDFSTARALSIGLKDTSVHTIHCRLDDDASCTVFMSNIKDTSIKSLSCRAANINIIAAGLKNTEIQTINLSGSLLNVSTVTALISGIKGSLIHTLNLDNTRLGSAEICALASGLKDTSIQTLCLRHSNIDATASSALIAGIKNSHILTLDLSCAFNKTATRDASFGIFVAGLKGTSLQTLDLSNNRLNETDIIAVALILKDTAIQILNLSCNPLNVFAITELIAGIKGSSIHTINLSTVSHPDHYYKCGDETPVHIKSQLNSARGVGFMEALVASLPDTLVRTIDLSNNELNEDAIRILTLGIIGTNVTKIIGICNPELEQALKANRDRQDAAMAVPTNRLVHSSAKDKEPTSNTHEAVTKEQETNTTVSLAVIPTPQVNPQEVTSFLTHIVRDEQVQIVAMLKKNPELALTAGSVTYHDGRTLNNITGFQLAIWTLNFDMWSVFKNYLSVESAQIQVASLGDCFDMQPLISALQIYALQSHANCTRESRCPTDLPREKIWENVRKEYAYLPTHIQRGNLVPDKPCRCYSSCANNCQHGFSVVNTAIRTVVNSSNSLARQRSSLMAELRVKILAVPIAEQKENVLSKQQMVMITETQQENALLRKQVSEMQQQILAMQQQMHLMMDMIARPAEQLHQAPRPITRAFDMAVQADVFFPHTAETFSQTTDSLVRVTPINTTVVFLPSIVNGGMEPRVRPT